MLSIAFIKHFIAENASIIYFIIILGALTEGEVVAILAGIFAHLGSINIFIAVVAILFGCTIKSFLGYSLGLYLERKHSHRPIIKKAETRINYFFPHFIKRPFISLFLSRFLILGIYWFSIVYAGYKKVNLKTYIRAEVTSFISWTIFMVSLGYFFSYTALSISRDVRNFLLLLLLFFIIFFLLEKVVAFFIELFELKEIK